MELCSFFHEVSTFFQQRPESTQREASKALGRSQSSVDRQRQSEKRRTRYSESTFWNTTAGYQWLCRLVFCALFVFVLQRGIGLETLCYFFRLLRIDTHIAVSASTLQNLSAILEDRILAYGENVQQQIQATSSLRESVVAVDETFFNSLMILVTMELSSGFLISEQFSEKRNYASWQPVVERCRQWRLNVHTLVSDQARALKQLAREGFQCSYLPDLFHAMHEICKTLSLPLIRQQRSALENLETSKQQFQRRQDQIDKLPEYLQQETPNPMVSLVEQAQFHSQQIQQERTSYRRLLETISAKLHPFSATDSTPQNSQDAQEGLAQTLEELKNLAQRCAIDDPKERLDGFFQQIPALSASIDLWWRQLERFFAQERLCAELQTWLTQFLLPAVYWKIQFQRTDQSVLRKKYQKLAQRAEALLIENPYSQTLNHEEQKQWEQWAQTAVAQFQRASSAVEGRNGFLAQHFHNRRGISQKRLQVLTIIHNFELRQRDGTTAAQRLYQTEFPDLAETILKELPTIPMSRTPKKRKKANSLKIKFDPA